LASNENVGAFYRHASKKFRCKSAVGPLQDEDGTLITDPECKANLLQSAFFSNHSADNGHLPIVQVSMHQAISVEFIFHLHLYVEPLRNSKLNKRGPNDIPPVFFKMLLMNCVIRYLCF
jgi:hypothetical protein